MGGVQRANESIMICLEERETEGEELSGGGAEKKLKFYSDPKQGAGKRQKHSCKPKSKEAESLFINKGAGKCPKTE